MKRKSIIITFALALCVAAALVGVLAACSNTETDSVFSSGMLGAQKDGGLWGYVSSDGEWVIDAKYDDVTQFAGNYAAVTLGSKHMLIDSDGNEVMELASLDISCNKDKTRISVNEKYTGMMGVINAENAEWVLQPAYDNIVFGESGYIYAGMSSAVGVFDADGAQILPVEYNAYLGSNADVFYKYTEEGTEINFFTPGAAPDKVVQEGAEVSYLSGSGEVVCYSYTDAEGNIVQKLPGNANSYVEGENPIYMAYDNVMLVEEYSEGTATGTMDLQKLDGTSITRQAFTGATYKSDHILSLSANNVDGSTIDWVVDTLGAQAASTADQAVRMGDNTVWVMSEDGKTFTSLDGASSKELTLGEGVKLEFMFSTTAYITSKAGVFTIVNNGAEVAALPLGTLYVAFTEDGAYVSAMNNRGYYAVYKADGTQVLGFDLQITDAA